MSRQEIKIPMNRLILADNQAIFRAGAARVLALEDDMRIAAQCEDGMKLFAAIEALRGSVLVVSTSLRLDYKDVLARVRSAGSRAVLVAENTEQVAEDISVLYDGVLSRNVPGSVLVDCVRRVTQGQRFVQRANVTTMQAADSVGTRVRDRLTPKEMQIVALIVQGCKNKDIATATGHQGAGDQELPSEHLRQNGGVGPARTRLVYDSPPRPG